jgi:hypothetical protein
MIRPALALGSCLYYLLYLARGHHVLLTDPTMKNFFFPL